MLQLYAGLLSTKHLIAEASERKQWKLLKQHNDHHHYHHYQGKCKVFSASYEQKQEDPFQQLPL
jgi:hypothetical protein